jgi:hypothetical protein
MTLKEENEEEKLSLPEGRFYNINFKILQTWMRNIEEQKNWRLK